MESLSVSLITVLNASGAYSLTLTNQAYGAFAHSIYRSGDDDEPEYEEIYISSDPVNERLTMSLHLDLVGNVVWGTYEFTATGNQDGEKSAAVNGSFLVRLNDPDTDF